MAEGSEVAEGLKLLRGLRRLLGLIWLWELRGLLV